MNKDALKLRISPERSSHPSRILGLFLMCFCALLLSAVSVYGAEVKQEVKRAPVELTEEEINKNYFLNLALRYKALDMDDSSGEMISHIIKPDTDLGTIDTSWHNRERGGLSQTHDEILQAYRQVDFEFYDQTLQQKADIKELKMAPCTGARRVFFGFDPTHEYVLTIVGSTVPSPYALGFSKQHPAYTSPIGSKIAFTLNDLSKQESVYQADKYNVPEPYEQHIDRFYNVDLFMAPLEFIFANSRDDAKEALSIRNHPTLKDMKTFVYDNSKIFQRLRVSNNQIPYPQGEPKREGYTFKGWAYDLLFPKGADGKPNETVNAYTIYNLLECTRQSGLTPEQTGQCYSDYNNWTPVPIRFKANSRTFHQWTIIRDGVINKYGMTPDFLQAESPVFIAYAYWVKADKKTEPTVTATTPKITTATTATASATTITPMEKNTSTSPSQVRHTVAKTGEKTYTDGLLGLGIMLLGGLLASINIEIKREAVFTESFVTHDMN